MVHKTFAAIFKHNQRVNIDRVQAVNLNNKGVERQQLRPQDCRLLPTCQNVDYRSCLWAPPA